MSDRLAALAERVEAAERADRELDAIIRCALFAPAGAYVEQSAINGAWVVYSGAMSRSGRPLLFEHWPSQEARNGAFTASIDAAMTLVPEGFKHSWSLIGSDEPSERGWQAEVACELADAATPALALCAAALHARSAL